MKISPLRPTKINFTSYDYYNQNFEDDVWSMADDDISSAKLRDALRARIYSRFLTCENYDKKIPEYAKTLDDVYILNLQNIGKNSYKGATLAKNPEYLDLLKPSNVMTIIDLANFKNLESECAARGLNYYKFTVNPDFWQNPIFYSDEELLKRKKEDLIKNGIVYSDFVTEFEKYKNEVNNERRDFMDMFLNFIDVVSRGNFYISCELGEDRTPNVLSLNTYFNPAWEGEKIQPTRPFIQNCIKNMYNNLTDADKQKLGFTEDFEDKLRENLQKAGD